MSVTQWWRRWPLNAHWSLLWNHWAAGGPNSDMSRNQQVSMTRVGNSADCPTKRNYIWQGAVDISLRLFTLLNSLCIPVIYVYANPSFKGSLYEHVCCLPIAQSRRPVGLGGRGKEWDLADSPGLLLWLFGSGGLRRDLAAGLPQSVHPPPHSWCLLVWRHAHQTNLFTSLKR